MARPWLFGGEFSEAMKPGALWRRSAAAMTLPLMKACLLPEEALLPVPLVLTATKPSLLAPL